MSRASRRPISRERAKPLTPNSGADPAQAFAAECHDNAAAMATTPALRELSRRWIVETAPYKYTYNFSWLGRPVIQFPQDLVAMQEIIWRVKPDLIVETGIAHGGSIVFYASILELVGGTGHVIGVDLEIRPHNRAAIEAHPMARRITMVEGSSVEEATLRRVRELARGCERVLVALDSNHTHGHVLRELELYSPLVTAGSYLVVFDTVVEDMPAEAFPHGRWGPGNNPMTAVREFLARTDRFVVDDDVENKLLISVAPSGYLRCVRD
jgi:cephalosporin hydroxylase